MTTAEIDNEFRRISPNLWEIKGNKCQYCGQPATCLHHIVQRCEGGDNRLSNIVPLCTECHNRAHHRRTYKKDVQYGRKRIEKPEQFDVVVDIYLDNHITLDEALRATGLKRHVFYRLFSEYRDRTGDKRKHRNIGNKGRREN